MGLPGRTPDVLRSHPPLADLLLTVRHPCHACAQRLRSARASPVLHACALPHSPPDESRHSLRPRLRNPCPPPPFGRERDGAPDRPLCQLCPRTDRLSRSEERRVGQTCASTCRARRSPPPSYKNTHIHPH